ncbi:hypothetical protein [Alicyclobacillus fastidiosus]|uniref:Uncharacterized protein n=1 Tax=Alicyclobacillus fastidiosus TaxID=392011 RepID=A0ABV5AI90_9BACL|nr:hypothetical protein [Alicyclobacillus fastidiosus]WEH11108.1 hypothetical protein PYS47_07790 [Alicyclobacillus fastidiosus]
MFTVYDAGTSTPGTTNGSLSRAIPGTPSNIVLAAFGVATGAAPNKVLLSATVGISATLLTPDVLFSIIRDTGVIFTTLAEASVSATQDETVSFSAVDSNVPAGYHSYQLVATVTNPSLNSANVVGPVTFTGISLQ